MGVHGEHGVGVGVYSTSKITQESETEVAQNEEDRKCQKKGELGSHKQQRMEKNSGKIPNRREMKCLVRGQETMFISFSKNP